MLVEPPIIILQCHAENKPPLQHFPLDILQTWVTPTYCCVDVRPKHRGALVPGQTKLGRWLADGKPKLAVRLFQELLLPSEPRIHSFPSSIGTCTADCSTHTHTHTDIHRHTHSVRTRECPHYIPYFLGDMFAGKASHPVQERRVLRGSGLPYSNKQVSNWSAGSSAGARTSALARSSSLAVPARPCKSICKVHARHRLRTWYCLKTVREEF